MCHPVISRKTIRERGRAAALRGDSREDHNMNWFALALPEWYAGYDLGKAEMILASHGAPAAGQRVELAQGEAA